MSIEREYTTLKSKFTNMAIITLTTDFGLKDHYAGAVKGAILKHIPQATIIDISHQIEKYNIQDASYILKAGYPDFPKGSIHIIGLLSEYAHTGGYLALEADGHYFIGADNGIFSLLFEEPPTHVVEIKMEKNQNLSFPVRDIFVKAACLLADGKTLKDIGKPKTELVQRMPFRAASMGDNIRGSIIYVDSYGNTITNINKNLFETVGKGRPFIIEMARNYVIERISNDYNEVPEGEIMALFNASERIEIAMRNGKISSMLNLKLNDSITIRFL